MIVEVYFFGGFKASQSDMQVWAASAKAQQGNIDFTAYYWFEEKKRDKAIAAIKASKADKIYIVGHSSGCADANAVDTALGKNTGNVVLVALDGFVPNGKQLARTSTQVWSALGPNGEPSWNYEIVHDAVGTRLTVNYPPNCTRKWPLHFSLVNANATDSTVKDPPDHLTTGYASCKAFLKWLC